MNDGTVNVDGGKWYSFGYTKGSGVINLTNGARAEDVLSIHDWRGGSETARLFNKDGLLGSTQAKTFLLNAYSCHNISCSTNIYNGSTYYAKFAVAASNYIKDMSNPPWEYLSVTSVCIFGKTGEGLFSFRSSTNNKEYIEKYAIPARNWSETSDNYKALYSITGSNQIMGQKDIVNIYGDCTDGTLTVTAQMLGEMSFTTSKTIALPISYMDIVVKGGGNLDLTSNAIKFLPGTSLTIEENATCTIGNGVNVLFYDVDSCYADEKDNALHNGNPFILTGKCIDWFDSKLIVNGTLTVNGGVGGKIQSTNTGARIVLNSTSASINIVSDYGTVTGVDAVTSSDIKYGVRTLPAKGDVVTGINVSTLYTLEASTYRSVNGAWYKEGAEFTVEIYEDGSIMKYEEGGEEKEKSITLIAGERLESGFLSLPTREYFLAGQLYTNQACTPETIFDPSTPIYSNVRLYAKYEKDPSYKYYTINFDTRVENNSIASKEILVKEDGEVTINNKPNDRSGYIFNCWILTNADGTTKTIEVGETCKIADLFKNGAEEITLMADWGIDCVTITVTIGDGVEKLVLTYKEEFSGEEKTNTFTTGGTVDVQIGTTIVYTVTAKGTHQNPLCSVNGGSGSGSGEFELKEATELACTAEVVPSGGGTCRMNVPTGYNNKMYVTLFISLLLISLILLAFVSMRKLKKLTI